MFIYICNSDSQLLQRCTRNDIKSSTVVAVTLKITQDNRSGAIQ